ncbi:MAG: orotidine-5'-phosphate decarboxylase [Proteobacteria bacterium]|nr:orotidine-5'-phosphate decarboxylase [Pseudomonadota bacterium]
MIKNNIAANERCIIALDVPDNATALQLVDTLSDVAAFYKIGLELFAAGVGRGLLDTLVAQQKKVFVDLKLYDVPETVARATRQVATSGANFLTVHGDEAIMQAAVANKGERLKILAVTALTSLDEQGLKQLGYRGSMRDFVLEKAQRAQAAGCDGVICSGLEVAMLREQLGDDFILVTPGIRQQSDAAGDQKRIATPAAVMAAGGDYLVIGRPVRDAAQPKQTLAQIVTEVETAVAARG